MSCSEVMYQAYYPYLYQRAGAAPPVSAHAVSRAGPFTSPFGAAHQYDRFNVQRLQEASHPLSQASTSGVLSSDHSHGLYLHAAHSSGSVSSTGGASPTSPLRPGKEEDCSLHGRSSAEVAQLEDESEEDAGGSRAQYVSANCVVFTHYQGDAASVVDEHFSRALDKTSPQTKDCPPMSQRIFPPSFWNSQHYQGATAGGHHELYAEHYHPSDPWYQYSSHHRAVHEYHHHNMAQYGGLLLPSSRLHMGTHPQCKAVDWQHPPLEPPYSSYPSMSGLEAQVQESSKDLYWF